jgi:hypothetical protein
MVNPIDQDQERAPRNNGFHYLKIVLPKLSLSSAGLLVIRETKLEGYGKPFPDAVLDLG